MGNRLREEVTAKFGTIADFAKAMNWEWKKASNIINRVQSPTVVEMEEMADCLGIKDADSFIKIFFTTIKEDQKMDGTYVYSKDIEALAKERFISEVRTALSNYDAEEQNPAAVLAAIGAMLIYMDEFIEAMNSSKKDEAEKQ